LFVEGVSEAFRELKAASIPGGSGTCAVPIGLTAPRTTQRADDPQRESLSI
jgi:hypothetical protein